MVDDAVNKTGTDFANQLARPDDSMLT